MRARLIVLAVFVSASAVPGLLAYSTGVLSSGASSEDGPLRASGEFRITSLDWPDRALGLAATARGVVWEQRSSDAATSGLWTYDVPSQQASRLLRPADLGRTVGAPSASGTTVVWAARSPAGNGVRVRGFDSQTGRRFAAAAQGVSPAVTEQTIVWVDTGGVRGRPRTSIAGLDLITDARFGFSTPAVVHDVVAVGRRVAWLGDAAAGAPVWAADLRTGRSSKLAAGGTALAMDARRLVWASRPSDGETAIAAWNPRTHRSKELYCVAARVSDLALGDGLVVWVQGTRGGDVWAYDFDRRRAFAVCDGGAAQTDAVVVGRSVFWADKRSGDWDLYGRSLQP